MTGTARPAEHQADPTGRAVTCLMGALTAYHSENIVAKGSALVGEEIVTITVHTPSRAPRRALELTRARIAEAPGAVVADLPELGIGTFSAVDEGSPTSPFAVVGLLDGSRRMYVEIKGGVQRRARAIAVWQLATAAARHPG
jgi:hypothetical protein